MAMFCKKGNTAAELDLFEALMLISPKTPEIAVKIHEDQKPQICLALPTYG